MHPVLWLVVLVVGFALSASASAADLKSGATDPEQAGPDYAVQGEYAGEVEGDKGPVKVGVQVIALGDGKFRGVGYHGGLPGAGWDKSERHQAEGERTDGVVRLRGEKGSAEIKDGVLTAYDPEGKKIGELKKVERKSPTLGAKPPRGAIVLFDGTSAEKFEGGRMTEDGLLMQGATSKETFQDATLHLEFQTPFMPQARGQGRGNSGSYLQGRYEVQILDSFGLEGKNNECGGVYQVADPNVNMCLPPLAWQTYDIDFRAARYDSAGNKTEPARMTVRHNGVLIHDNLEVPRATPGNRLPEGPQPGPLYLQDHGNPVRFRNIWLLKSPSR